LLFHVVWLLFGAVNRIIIQNTIKLTSKMVINVKFEPNQFAKSLSGFGTMFSIAATM